MPAEKWIIHTPDELAGIRRAAGVTADVLDELCGAIYPGMTTWQLDQLAAGVIARHGGVSAFHQYRGFPGQVCISINDEVVHGIGRPERQIQAGDLVSIDCGVRIDGYIGDTARTVMVGAVDGLRRELVEATRESLMAGIAAAVGGGTVYDIGAAVERVVSAAGFSVVRDFVGHGCGVRLHEPPEVPNYPLRQNRRIELRPGMVLAIEPMVNIGRAAVRVEDDRWTVRTVDGSCSAHFEHMIVITENEPEIITWPTKRSEWKA